MSDCQHDIPNAIHAEHCQWICPKCKADISVAYLLYIQAMNGEPAGCEGKVSAELLILLGALMLVAALAIATKGVWW